MVRVMEFYLDGTVNFYMRPVEGVTVTVDLDEMEDRRFCGQVNGSDPESRQYRLLRILFRHP